MASVLIDLAWLALGFALGYPFGYHLPEISEWLKS